jgi:aspartate dehydrogenase
MLKIGLVGCGEIGRSILTALQINPIEGIVVDLVCCRPSQAAIARALSPPAQIVTRWPGKLERPLDVVIEAAGQAALREIGRDALDQGADLFILSVGALADPVFCAELIEAAEGGNARMLVPAGALAGFDGLHSLRHAGLRSVLYRSTKPPSAWKGTPAEQVVDLDSVQSPTTVFKGNAKEAALRFPRNANLAAAVALAGIGFDRTDVELVADPDMQGNSGRVIAIGEDTTLELELHGSGFEGNPKSSRITGMSVVAALSNRLARIAFSS